MKKIRQFTGTFLHHSIFGKRPQIVLIAFALFCGALFSAQAQSVVSSVLPSNATPAAGTTITVDIQVDMTGMAAPDSLLGSFTATFSWDPMILNYVSNSGILSGFIGNVNVDVIAGTVSFNGVNVAGVGGVFNVLQMEFSVTGAAGAAGAMQLAYSAMLTANTFTDLLPFLTANDATITVSGGAQQNVLSSVIPSTTTPAGGDTFRVDIQVDMTAMAPPDSLLGSFTATLSWDPTVLNYVSNSGILSGFLGNVNVDAVAGTVTFNGVNVNGLGGVFSVLQLEFAAAGISGDISPLNLSYTALSAAGSFTNLLPALVVNDTTITIQEATDIVISIPDHLQGVAGDTVDVPVSLTLNGNVVESLGAAIKATGGLLTFVGFVTGPIVPGAIFDVNAPAADSVRIGFFNAGDGPITEDGRLVTLQFVIAATAAEGDMALLNFSELSAADPELKPLNVGGEDGKMTVVAEVSISGTVLYCAIAGGGDAANPVADLNAELSQGGAVLQSVPTDAAGNYTLSGIMPGSDYRVEVRRVSGATGAALTPTDALICFNAFLGNIVLNGCRKLASDVNCDKAINPTDALLIFNRFLGNITVFPCGADWRTFPAGYDIDATTDAWQTAPEGIDYPALGSDQTAQDYLAVVLGDADLSWPNPALAAPLAKAGEIPAADLEINLLPSHSTGGARSVTWRVQVQGDPLQKGIAALGGEVQFEQEMWEISAISWGEAAIEGFRWDHHLLNQTAPGATGVRFGGFSLSEAVLQHAGTVLEIRARAKSPAALEEEHRPRLAALSAAAPDFRGIPVVSNALATPHHGETAGTEIPSEFLLEGNYPNPFNPTTHIRYRLPEDAQVSMAIFNALGQRVRQLLNQQHHPAGVYEVEWNGRDDSGQRVTSGLYFYIFQAKAATQVITQTRKMLMMK